jgi:HEAT repeat protein
MTIAVQELSSKVSNILFGFQASDTQVQGLMTRLADPNAPTRYLDTYALGFANNPLAIDKLAALTKDPDDYVRLAAISSLGTLHATAQMPLLKQIYEDPKALWQERAMAIKAIGDLDTLAAKAYLTAEFKKLASQPINDDNTRLSLVMMIYYR